MFRGFFLYVPIVKYTLAIIVELVYGLPSSVLGGEGNSS